MSSAIRKLQKKLKAAQTVDLDASPGMGQPGTPMCRVIRKVNPKTGEMQDFHLTKGWKK